MRPSSTTAATLLALSSLLGAALVAAPALADPCAPPLPGVIAPEPGTTIELVAIDAGRPPDRMVLRQAAKAWNKTCRGWALPTIRIGERGSARFRVYFHDGTDRANGLDFEGECAGAILLTAGGRIVGGRIHLYARAGKNGRRCDDVANLTHELGHAFGLDDAACPGRIMGDHRRPLTGKDCAAAARLSPRLGEVRSRH